MKLTPDHYDKGILHPRMRALLNGDFYNVGWWDAAAGDDPNLACTRLVERMLACDDDKAAVTAIADVGCGLGAGAAEATAVVDPTRGPPHPPRSGRGLNSSPAGHQRPAES